MLRKRRIGSLEVSVVGIGCNNFGRELDAAATREIVHAALDEGITFFDTADSYGKPKTSSESLLGEALVGRRNDIVLATKFGRTLDEQRGGASPAYVRAATEASLQRLRTDRIDLMQLHIPDPKTPIEDTLGGLQDLVSEGKIREIGNSNVTTEELAAADDKALAGGLPQFVSTQVEFNMLYREPVVSILAECERREIKLLPFRPLYHGLLTGKYNLREPLPAGTRIGDKDAEYQARILSASNIAKVEALTRFAEERDRSLLELAFGWLLAHEAVPSVIAGVSSVRQVASNVRVAGWALSPEEKASVDALIA